MQIPLWDVQFWVHPSAESPALAKSLLFRTMEGRQQGRCIGFRGDQRENPTFVSETLRSL